MKKSKIFLIAVLLFCQALFFGVGLMTVSAQEADANIGKTHVIDHCNSADNWLTPATMCTVDTTNYITGSGCIYLQSSIAIFQASFRDFENSPSDMPAFEDAYLEFYYWVTDIDNINVGGVELNSSGILEFDSIVHAVNKKSVDLKNGWNFVSLKLTDFSLQNGVFNLNNLKGMRLYCMPLSGANEIRLDEITITDTPQLENVRKSGIHPKSTPDFSLDQKVSEKIYSPNVTKGAYVAMIIIGGVLIAAGIATITVLLIKRKGAAK